MKNVRIELQNTQIIHLQLIHVNLKLPHLSYDGCQVNTCQSEFLINKCSHLSFDGSQVRIRFIVQVMNNIYRDEMNERKIKHSDKLKINNHSLKNQNHLSFIYVHFIKRRQ